MNKTKVNIIYSPQIGQATCPRFSNEKGEVWMNPIRMNGFHNISMGFYSANYPHPIQDGDSFYAVEPMCVSERDYEIDFLSKFKYVFTWAVEAFKKTSISNKLIEINHPSCNGVNEHEYEKRKSDWKNWNNRRNEIVLIANNKHSSHHSELYSLRTKLAQWLDNHYSNNSMNISWYAQSPHVPGKYFKGRIDGDKGQILNNVKFSICSENCYSSKYSYNYFTEKMPEVWFSGAVPLYMGCYNIDQFGFHSDSYIDLRKYVNDKNINYLGIVNEINNFNEEKYNNYLKAIEYNIYNAKLFNLISDERVMSKMIETFWKEENGV
jgi:hypothetical protein